MPGELESEWLEMMPDSVTITPFLSRNVRGEPEYDTQSSYTVRARVEQSMREFRTKEGSVRVAQTVVYPFNPPKAIGPNDQFTLPDGSSPPTLGVLRETDDLGIHHYECYLAKVPLS